MFLYLDTTKKNRIIFSVIDKNKKIIKRKTFNSGRKKFEKIVKFLDIFLEQINLNLEDFQALLIVKEKGSFTDIRIGVLFLDIIAICKNIKIIGLKNKGDIKENLNQKFIKTKLIFPKYQPKKFEANLKV